MRPEVKEEWVEALRSGEYEQTKGFLHRLEANDDIPVGYCCLGVLCDLAVKAGVVENDPDGVVEYFGNEQAVLPRAVEIWAGLDQEGKLPTPIVMGDNEAKAMSLVSLNDSYNYTFEQIADVVEEQF